MTFAVLDGGSYYHREAIHGPRYRDLFDKSIYTPELASADLDDVSVLIVPDRSHPALLRSHRGLFDSFLKEGRTLVVFGENAAESWAPNVAWSPRPTNFWWWLEPGAEPPQHLAAPDHEIFRSVVFRDSIWHFHGVLQPPAGAETLIAVPADPEGRDNGGALLYDDRVSTPGRLIVATLDPFYHHGSRFMPATTRFLDGFLPWARELAHRPR